MTPLEEIADYAGDKPQCPKCEEPMRLRRSTTYRYPSGRLRLFWSCRCGSSCGAHPDGTALGYPAPDQDTKLARIEAHEAIERLAKMRGDGKSAMYAWMAEAMQLDAEACHIAKFDLALCRKLCELVADEVNRIYEERSENQHW